LSKTRILAGVAVLAAVVLLAAAVARGPQAAASGEGGQPERLIRVTGTGKVSVVPDMAVVNLAVEATGRTAGEAQDRASRAMDAVLRAVKGLGVAEKDVQTSRIGLYPLYEESKPEREPGPPRVVGFRAENGVRVVVRDLARVGAVVDAAVSAGANRVEGVLFQLSDPGPWWDRALELAVVDARRQAELAARAAGVEVRGVRSITVLGGSPAPVVRSAQVYAAAGSVPVEPGVLELTASVEVVFEF